MAFGRPEVPKPKRRIRWDGKASTSDEITEWARDSSGATRWQYNAVRVALGHDEVARLHVQRPFPESASWEPVEIGSYVVRQDDDPDSPLSIESTKKESDATT